MIYNELKQHGTDDFPFELYQLTKSHPRYEMAFHWHSNLELVRVLSGTLSLTLDNRPYLLHANEIAIINSETVHGATPHDCTYECIVYNLSFLKTGNALCDGFIDDLLSREKFLCEQPTDEETVALVHEIFRTIGEGDAGYAFSLIGRMQELLGVVQRKQLFTSQLPPSSVRDGKKVLKLKRVLKYIRDHFAEDIRLEDMSAVTDFSCKYFCKFFRDMTGTTPVNYLLAYRVERSARKLLGSDLSVTQIAYTCGFNDLSYFIKTFKRFYGVSPTEYRNR